MNYYSFFRPFSWRKWFKRNTKYQFFKQHKYFSLKEINFLLNQSKVCLNVHQEFTKNALNIRTFEIIGAGKSQLVEDFDSVKNIFKSNKSIISYNSAKDLVSKLKIVIKNSESDCQVDHDHTFINRVNEIMRIIE